MGLIEGNLHVQGTLSCGAAALPPAGVAASMVVHRQHARHAQNAGADVAAATAPVFVCQAGATLQAVKVGVHTAPTGGNKQYTVDVQRGNQGTAFATLLSSVVTIDSSKADRQVVSASLATTALSAGDLLRVVVTPSGSTGAQGQGVAVEIILDENPS